MSNGNITTTPHPINPNTLRVRRYRERPLLEELPALQTCPRPPLQGPTSDGSLPRRSLLIQFVPSQ